MIVHYISPTVDGEYCVLCKDLVPATHKIGEEIPYDDPGIRHNFTSYVCCNHFIQLFGKRVFCSINQELFA